MAITAQTLVTETIEGQSFQLRPNQFQAIEQFYDVQQGYGALNQVAQRNVTRELLPSTELISEHKTLISGGVPKELCDGLIQEMEANPDAMQHPDVLKIILPFVFTDAVDKQLASYFGSEYCLFWYSFYSVNDNEADGDYFKRWHCDGGPSKHLKIIIYLNGHEEHGSNTAFYDKETTQKLKELGYIFTDLDNRKLDIEPLLEKHGIVPKLTYASPQAGDVLLFNPYQLAHKAIVSNKGQKRFVFNACIVPSPVHWQNVLDNHHFPSYNCQSFEGFAPKVLSFLKSPANAQGLITVAAQNRIVSHEHLRFVVLSIFSDREFAEQVAENIRQQDPELKICIDLSTLFNLLKSQLTQSLNKEQLNVDDISKLKELAEFDEKYGNSVRRYMDTEKPNPLGIFWPNPVHPKHPRNKFDMLPYVQTHGIMDADTPIGSAGSCFAFEIARVFQQEGFNYVVTERNDDPNSGIVVDGYNPGDPWARFSANYGILFNTPSFLQLAEKAFGIRHFNKFLIELPDGGYFDPYRENVTFLTPDAFQADYDKHVAAVREAFLQAEVFVLTLGLNECWQLHDGTVMSRNPRDNMYHLVTHKTLTVEENVQNIQRFYDIVRSHNPHFKIVLSLSPIPFLATGRADTHHIIEANTHSKATLRVAADELVRNNDGIFYLPSYELVTECIEQPWKPDHRHVTEDTVVKVVEMFKQMFVKQ